MPNIMQKYFSSIDVVKVMKIVDKLIGVFGNVEIFLGCLVGMIFIVSCIISSWALKYKVA